MNTEKSGADLGIAKILPFLYYFSYYHLNCTQSNVLSNLFIYVILFNFLPQNFFAFNSYYAQSIPYTSN
jgi:hypothetical protein